MSDETRDNFIWLGILPEDVTITQTMTATLWDIDDVRDAAGELPYWRDKLKIVQWNGGKKGEIDGERS